MRQIYELEMLHAPLRHAHQDGKRIGFVPTMGNLHDGHLALVRRARSMSDFTAVSIFVNPFQFGEGEDYATYPRTLERDLGLLEQCGTDLVFMPPVEGLYPHGPDRVTRIEVPQLGDVLCGASRPGFFRGVCTVVNILLNLVRADVAFFGEKDYQQLLVIRRMVADLRMPVEIEAVETCREPDGLAMSSRNNYLSEVERTKAPTLYRVLLHLRERITAGDKLDATLFEAAEEELHKNDFKVDYLSVRRAEDLAEAQEKDLSLRIIAAAWIGKTRLIDNIAVER